LKRQSFGSLLQRFQNPARRLQSDLFPQEKPGAMVAHRGPGIVSTPLKEFQHANYSTFSSRNLFASFPMGKPSSSQAFPQDHGLANRPQLMRLPRPGAHMSKRFKVTTRKMPDGSPFITSGQEAKTHLLLQEKGALGVVAYDFRGGPPFRLPAYTWSLMRNHGLTIETRREKHECGWHGRFVLHTPIEILVVDDPAKQPERLAA
jgi:hypothetical protein